MSLAPQPASTPVVWAERREPFQAHLAGTLELTRADWEALGAHFFEIDDQLGGISLLATGVAGDVSAPFGVLDHDEDITSLLAPLGSSEIVMDAIVAAGVPPHAILERLPRSATQVPLSLALLANRVADLERQMAELASPSPRRAAS
jgi:hypothetical protein